MSKGTVIRTLSGVVFLVVMIGCLLWNGYAFGALFLFIQCVMLGEFYHMTLGSSHRGIQLGGMAVAAAAFVLTFLAAGPAALPVKYLSCVLGCLIMLMGAMVVRHNGIKDYAYILAGLLYIGLPLALSPWVVFQNGLYSGKLMLGFFILIWSSDVGAYCFGMLLGQKAWSKKMCPEISPKKSWAGFWGGMLVAIAAALVLHFTGYTGTLPLVHVLVVAVLIHVAGVFGDLFESVWKRAFQVKDSGNIMPGHGGLMDRFDSALFAIPAAYLYLLIVL